MRSKIIWLVIYVDVLDIKHNLKAIKRFGGGRKMKVVNQKTPSIDGKGIMMGKTSFHG